MPNHGPRTTDTVQAGKLAWFLRVISDSFGRQCEPTTGQRYILRVVRRLTRKNTKGTENILDLRL